ncbi:hypothetical protein [Bremerella cremea]|uniref:hypothetical protein n=1 Tax=Bremerella cremea TaxID=1031537 RepID=UPI0031EEFFF4
MISLQKPWAGLVLGLVVCALGCGPEIRPGEAFVHGTITLQGQPVPAGKGSLNLVSPTSVGVAKIEPDGSFETTLPPGEYQVAIRYKDGNDWMNEQGKMVFANDLVPKKYGDVKTSDLTATVVEGANEVNFDLE